MELEKRLGTFEITMKVNKEALEKIEKKTDSIEIKVNTIGESLAGIKPLLEMLKSESGLPKCADRNVRLSAVESKVKWMLRGLWIILISIAGFFAKEFLTTN